jgi:hypothetical protein
VIAQGLGSCKLRSPILSVTESRDPKTIFEPGENLVADSNAIDLRSSWWASTVMVYDNEFE